MAFDLIPEDSINLGAYKSAAQKFSANYPNGITNPYEEEKVEGDRSRLDSTIYSKAYEYAQVDWDNAVSAVTRKRQDFLDLWGQFYSSGSYVDAYGNVKSNQNALDAADRYEFAEYLHDLYPEFSVDYFYKNAESFMKQATGVEANIKSYADHIGKTWNMAWSNFALGWEAFTNYVGYGLTGQFGSQAWENKKEEMAQHRAVSAANYRKDLGDDVYDGLLQKMLSGTVEQSPQIAMMLAQMALTGGVGGVSGYLASKEMIKSSTAQTLAKVAKGLSVATNFAISGIGDGGSAMSDCYEFGFSDETSLWAGLLVGLFTGYVETWGDDQLLKPLNDAVDRVLKLGDGDLMHQAVKSFGESLKDSAWKKARHVAASEITEPAQEELEYMAELFIKAVANQYEISTGGGTDWESIGYTKEQFWENTKETIVQTMLSTPLMTLGGLAASSGFDVVMGQGSAQWTPKRYMNKEGATNVTSTANFYLGGLKVDENIKDGDNGKANPIKVVQIGDYIFPTEAVSKKQEEAIRNKMVVYTIDEGSKLTTKTKTELEATSVDPDVTLTREKAGEYLAVMYEKGVLESYGFGEEEGLLDKISNKIKEESSPLESQSTEETDVLYVELKGKDSPVKINIGEEMSTQGSLDELQDITGVHMESIMSETAREARIRKKAEEIEKKRAAKQAEKDKKAEETTDNATQSATVTPDIVQAVKTEAQAQANTTGTNTATSTPADTQTIDTSRALNYRNFERFYKNEQFSSYEAYDAALNPTTDYLHAKYVKLSKEDGNSIVVSLPPSEVSKKAILNNVSTNPYKAEVKQTNVQQAKEKTSDTKKALEAVGVDTGTAGTVKTVSTEKQKTEVEKKQTQETKSETKESKAQNETKKESVKPIGEGELTDEEGKTWKSLEFCQEDDLTEEKKKHGKLLKKTSDGDTDYYYYEDGTALMVEDVTREQVKWMKEHPKAYYEPANTAPTEGEVISKSADIAKQNNVSNDEGTEAAVIGVGVQNAQDLITKNQTSFDDVVNKLTEEYIKKAIGEKKKLSKKLRAVAEAISKIEGIDNVYRQIFGENATVNEKTKEEFSKLFIDYMNNRDVEINEATKVFFDTIKQGVLASYLVNESTIQGDEKTELNTLKDKEAKETKTSKEALKDLQKKEEKQVKEESQKEKENATKQEETISETKPENKEEPKQETNEEVKTETNEEVKTETKEETKTETKEETKEETKTETEKPADPKTVISENPVLRTAVALAMEARKYYRYQEGLQQDEAKKKHMHDLFVIYDDWYTKMFENLDTNTAYEFLSSTEASRLITLQGNTYKVKGKKKDGTIVDMDKKFAVDPSFLSKRKEAILSDYIVTYYSTEVAKEVMTKQDLKALSISPYLVSKMGTALVNGIDSYFSDIIKNDFLSAITIEGQPDKGETYRDYVIRKLREMQTPEDDLTVMSNIATTISNIDMANVDERDMAIMNDSALRKNFQNIMSQILLEDFLNQYPEGTKTSKAKIEEYINKKWNNSVSNFTNLMADTSIYNVFKNLAKYEANATEKLTPEVEDKVREQRGVSAAESQIKSATDNNGDFSSESDDIRYQDSATPLNQTIQGKVNPANVVSSFKYDTSKGKYFISGGVYNEIVEIMNSSFPIQNEDIQKEVRKTATLATAFLTSLSEDVQDAIVRKSIMATGGKLLTGENENLLRLFFNMNELKDTSSVSDTTKGLSLSQSAKIILGMNSDESTVRHEGTHIIWWLDPKFRERAQNEYKKYFEKDSEGKQIRAVVEAHLDRFGGYTADQIIEGLRNLTRDDYDYTSDTFLSSEEAIAYMGEMHWEGLDDVKYSEGLKGLFERLANILKEAFEKLKNFFNTDLLVETNNNIYAPLFENEAGARDYYNELKAQEAEYITIPERAHTRTLAVSVDGNTQVMERDGTLTLTRSMTTVALSDALANDGYMAMPSIALSPIKGVSLAYADNTGIILIGGQQQAESYINQGYAYDRNLSSGTYPKIVDGKFTESGEPADLGGAFEILEQRPIINTDGIEWEIPLFAVAASGANKITSLEDARTRSFEYNMAQEDKAMSAWKAVFKKTEDVFHYQDNIMSVYEAIGTMLQGYGRNGERDFESLRGILYLRYANEFGVINYEGIDSLVELIKIAFAEGDKSSYNYGEVKPRTLVNLSDFRAAIALKGISPDEIKELREKYGLKVISVDELVVRGEFTPNEDGAIRRILQKVVSSTVGASERLEFQKMADVVQGAYENEQLRDDVQAKEQYESLVYLHATKNAEKVIKNWRKSLGDFFVDENSISTLKSELENSGVFSAIQGISPELAEEVKDEVARRIAYESEDYVSTAENLGKLKANLKDKNGEYKSADSKEVNDALYALYGYRQREISNQNGTKTVETVPVGILSKIMANDSKGSYARVKEYLLSEFRQAENQTGVTLDNELKQILLDKNEWKAIKKNGSSTVKESNNTALNFKLEEHGIEVQDLDNFLSILISENDGKYSPVMWRSNSEDAVFSDGYTVSGPLVDMLNYIHKDETQQNYTKNPTAIADDVYIKAAYNTLDKTFKKGDKLDIYIMDQMSQDYLGAIEKVDSTLLKNVYGTKLSADFFEELKKSIDKNLQNKIDDLNEIQAQADLFEGVSSTDELVKVLDSVFEEINTTSKTVTKTVDGLSGLTSLEIHNLKQQFESAKKTIEELKKQEEALKNSDAYKKNSKLVKERDAAIKKADEAIKNYKNRKARIIEEAANILTAAGRMNLKDTNLTAEAKDALYQVNNLIKDLRQEIRTLEKDNTKLTNQLNEAITRLSNELGIARGMAKDFNNAGVLSLFELQIREMQNVAKDSGNDIVSKKLSKILEYLVPQIAKGAERLMPKDVISFETIYTSLISPNYQEYRSHANALMNFILSEMSEPREVPNVYKISKTVRQLTAGQLVELSNLVAQVASDSMKYYKETTQQERDYHSEWHKAIAREIVEFAKEKGINAGELTEADSIGASSAKDIAVSKLQSLFNEFMLKSVEYRDRFPTLYAYIYGGVDHQGKVWGGLNDGMNEVSASAREKFDRIKKSIINNFSNSMFFEGELTEKNLANNMNALKTKYETTLSEDTFTQEDMKATGYTISEYDHLNRKKRTVFVDEDNDSAMREVARWWGKKQIKLFKLRDKLDSTFEKFGNKNRQIDLRRNIIYNAQVGIEKTKTLTTIDEKEKQARINKLENRIKATQDLLSRDYDVQASRSEKMEILKRRIRMAEQELGTRPNANVAKYTTQELLAIYMYARQEGGIDRLVYTPGFDKDGNALPNGSKTNNLSIGNIIWVVKQFENNSEFAPLKKFADDLSSIASENFEKIRDVKYYLSDGNVWLDPIKNYFAFTVDEDAFYEYGADIDTGLLAKYNEVGEAEVKHLAKNAKANDSMTKERTGNSALNLKIMDRMFNAIYRQEYYIGMGKPIYELKGLLNDEEFQSAMRTYYGRNGGNQQLVSLGKYVNALGNSQKTVSASAIDEGVRFLTSNTAAAAMAFRLTTVAQQIPTMLWCLKDKHIGLKGLVSAMWRAFSDKGVYKYSPQMEERANSALSAIRQSKNIGTFLSQSARFKGLGISVEKFINQAQNTGLWLLEKTDTYIANAMWYAYYEGVRQENIEKGLNNSLSVEEFNTLCANEATQRVMDISPVQSAKDNAVMYSNKNPWVRSALLFTNQTTKMLNGIIGSFRDMDIKGAEYLAKVLGISVLTFVLNGLITGKLVRKSKDDDDDEAKVHLISNTFYSIEQGVMDLFPLLDSIIGEENYGATNLRNDIENLVNVIGKDKDDRSEHQLANAWSYLVTDIMSGAGFAGTEARSIYRAFREGNPVYAYNTKWGEFTDRSEK